MIQRNSPDTDGPIMPVTVCSVEPSSSTGASMAGGVLRRLLDEDAALLAVYLDVPLGDVENRRG